MTSPPSSPIPCQGLQSSSSITYYTVPTETFIGSLQACPASSIKPVRQTFQYSQALPSLASQLVTMTLETKQQACRDAHLDASALLYSSHNRLAGHKQHHCKLVLLHGHAGTDSEGQAGSRHACVRPWNMVSSLVLTSPCVFICRAHHSSCVSPSLGTAVRAATSLSSVRMPQIEPPNHVHNDTFCHL